MKKDPRDASNKIAIVLLALVFLLVIVVSVIFLESEELAHGRAASGWYISAIQAISVNDV